MYLYGENAESSSLDMNKEADHEAEEYYDEEEEDPTSYVNEK